MGFMQNTSPLRHLPTDVTLKLSDGAIKAQKMMLAFISPVFERMFYGNFKEAKSKVVQLPSDSHKIMRLLLNIVFEESCEMESLDDIIPLMEVVERYQINKAPVQQMCDEAILTQMNAGNFFILLPKFASFMHEENIKKAADKVMCCTNNDFMASYNQAKILPEEVMLPLLQHQSLYNHDVKIFEFFLKWHNHQTQCLSKSLHLTSHLFECVRYTRIIPQVLTSRVVNCNLVDKRLLSNAYHFMYSCSDGIDRNSQQKASIFRRPMGIVKFGWQGSDTVKLVHDHLFYFHIGVSGNFEAILLNQYIVKSAPLTEDEIYWFQFSNLHFSQGCGLTELLLAITDTSERHLLSTPISNNYVVTLYVYGRHAFLKLVDSTGNMIVSTFSITGNNPFSVRICKPAGYSKKKVTFSFNL